MNELNLHGLYEALERRSLALFLGSDLPAILTGQPSRSDLARGLAQSRGLPPALTLAEAAEQLGGGNRFDFTSYLRRNLDSSGKLPQPFHLQVVELVRRCALETIVTVAWDNLLEVAFRQRGQPINQLIRGDDIAFVRAGQPTLIKLYGDMQQVDTLVVTERDHAALLRDPSRKPLLDEVRRTFRRCTVLFLGYHFDDADLRFLFDEVTDTQWTPLAYAAWPGLNPAETQMWRSRGIQVQDTDPLSLLTNLLAQQPPSHTAPAVEAPQTTADAETKQARTTAVIGSPQPPPLNNGQAWALLVGVNLYLDALIQDLHVCVADALALEKQLTADYQVVRLLADSAPQPPTRANILGELASLANIAGEDDLLLFYFSGHGVALEGESYLVPADARLSALTYTAVSMAEVHAILRQSAARAKVVILDACHAGASIGKDAAVMTPEFIARVFEQAEGMAVLASCKQGQRSWEWGQQGRSVFTHFLLEALAGQADFDHKGFVTVQDANRYVSDGVKRWSAQNGAPQTPTLSYQVAGDIILARHSP